MKREDILSGFEGLSMSEHDFLKDVVDYFEGKFSDISDLLDVKGVEDLTRVEDAKILVDNIKDDLY